MKDDLISRQAAIDAALTKLTKKERKNLLHTWSTVEVKYWVTELLENLPSVEAVPVVHGRWAVAYLDHEAFGIRPKILYCSNCNQCIAYKVNYCPNCGAKMEGAEYENLG